MYNKKKILFTGITPTGSLTLGHYLGIIKNLLEEQKKYQIFLMIADLHALTTIPQKNEEKINYKEKSKEIASIIYSCGIKEENCKIFIQSEIKEHLELSYFLSSYCSLGRLKNMTQYKEKSKEDKFSSLSLFSYPILMASDILLYDVDKVIVGKDQKQHLELTKIIAKKFNENNSIYLKIPEFFIPKFGSKIMGLKDPLKKMSKSKNDNILILDKEEKIYEKIMKAKTDSEGKIYFDEIKKPGISNLLMIYSCLKNLEIKDSEILFSNRDYNYLKICVIEEINKKINAIKSNFLFYYEKIESIISKNNKIISIIAKNKIGIIKKEIKLWN